MTHATHLTTTVAVDAGKPDRLVAAVLRRLGQVDEPLVLGEATVTAEYNPVYVRDEVTITAPYAKQSADHEEPRADWRDETTLADVVEAIKALHADVRRGMGAKPTADEEAHFARMQDGINGAIERADGVMAKMAPAITFDVPVAHGLTREDVQRGLRRTYERGIN